MKEETSFNIRLASIEDCADIIKLHKKYLYDNTTHIRTKGFVRVLYSEEEVGKIIRSKEIVVASFESEIVGYYLLGHTSNAKSLSYQYEALNKLHLNGQLLKDFKLACGAQAIVEEKFRGAGLTGKMLSLLIENVKPKYDYTFSSITKINQNAFKVHEKSGYIVVGEDETKVFVLLKIK